MSDLNEEGRTAKLAEAVVTRGNNLVLYAPPAPSAARPILTGLLAPAEGGPPRLKLALTPDPAIEEWARAGGRIAGATGVQVTAALTPARLTRLLRSDTAGLVFTSPDTAYELVRKAGLSLSELGSLLLVWPEAWTDPEVASLLLQDVPKEVQRVVITADPTGVAPFVERYCWRAHLADLLGPEPLDPAPAVRSMPVSWSGRREALVGLVEELDPESLAVWAPDSGDHAPLAEALRAAGVAAVIGAELPEQTGLIVAYDLPTPARLRQLAANGGSVVLLAPPGTEGYVSRLAPLRRPLHGLGALGAAQAGLARSRRSIADAVERGPATGVFGAWAPIFERYEATAVAAALYQLWEQAVAERGEPAAPARPPVASSQLWVGIGKRDAVTPHDLVAALLKDGVPKEAIGKIEIRESFTLVQLGSGVAAPEVAERLTGKTIRKRRLVARVDRGRPPKVRGER